MKQRVENNQTADLFSSSRRRERQNKEIIDTPEHRQKLLSTLSNHIGEMNAISMSELYELVFDRPWNDRINDTRALRHLVTAMRQDGVPICSATSQSGGGYYIAAAGSEIANFLRKRERRALLILSMNAKMKRTSLPNYLGQLKIDMEANQ